MKRSTAHTAFAEIVRFAALAPALLLAGCATTPPAPSVYTGGTQTTTTPFRADRGPGAEHCDAMDEVLEALKTSRFAEAEAALVVMQARFETLETAGTRLVSFGSQAEYDEYVQSIPDARMISPVDACYAMILARRGFAAAAEHDYLTALDHLDRAAEASPTLSQAHVERGYVLNRLGRPQDGYAAYALAVDLAERHRTSANDLPIALRGLGFSLIDLGRLDEAEAAFRRSLDLEPGNGLAEHELRYIEHLRGR